MAGTATHAKPAAARDHCLAPTRVVDAPIHGGRYQRMFPDLPALQSDAELLRTIGARGGPCHAADDGDARVAAGWPFFGQFVAHDITADRSPLTDEADTEAIRNSRSPTADLDCLYGDGPVGSPYLFDRADPVKMLLGAGGTDLPRNEQGIALVGDPRNDVHLFMNRMQLGMLKAHNALVNRLREDGVDELLVFDDARRALVWHYQWVILHDFLPSLIGADEAAERLRAGAALYADADQPYIPFEFADAAYRYGHAQIRNSYRIDGSGRELAVFPDLIGFRPVDRDRSLDWSLMFDVPGAEPAQRSKRMDGRLPSCLIELPVEIVGEGGDPAYRSLATRDLQRGQGTGLPSGEAVARELGVDPLTEDQVGLADSGWTGETPLWFYILREADALHDGDRLGPVGGRIVGEVLVGIIDSDPTSFRAVDASWSPTLPAAGERFTLVDLLTAGDS